MKTNIKKLGIIGGIGPESTIEYYRLILKRFQERFNTKEYPEILINSINLTELMNYIYSDQKQKLVNLIVDKVKILESAGIEYGAIASNTPHIVFEKIKEKVNIPLISIVEETCKEIKDKKMKRVGLFGTKSTMTAGFYNKVAAKYGIDIIIPESHKQDFINDKYMNELLFNRIVPQTKKQLILIARELIEEESIEGLILGGTELPLILNQTDFEDISILDTTKIHVESIVAKMI